MTWHLEDNMLNVDLAGLALANPTMLASGILGLTADALGTAVAGGAAAIVTKSVGLKPRKGYVNPTVVQASCGLINAMGLPNPGIEEFQGEIREAKGFGVPVVVSVYGFSAEEYVEVAKKAVSAGADAVELNVSCPHVKETGSEIGQNLEVLTEVVGEVKANIRRPVFVKLSPNVTSIQEIGEAVANCGADALTAINTVRATAIDTETAMPILSNQKGGLSGPAIKPIAIRCVYEIYERTELPIVGCGGITDWQDAVDFLLAGTTTAIQIGTAVAERGLRVFQAVTQGIETYLKRKSYQRVEDIVGLSHRK